MVSAPRLVIAATRSGDGKTTVATGLMAALAARGLAVSAHKVGPDYIDPGYHAAATGSPGRNLDAWLTGEELIEPLFLHGARHPRRADVSVIEGVMGLFDGVSGRGDLASTAHVARLLRAPVILVLNASGAARSAAATVHGFATFDPRVRLAGVVLNQVGSPRHEAVLRDAIAGCCSSAPRGFPVLGALPAEATLHTPSRHLGLVPAAERAGQVSDWLPRLRELAARHLDLDGLLAIARAAPDLAGPEWSPAAPEGTGPASAGLGSARRGSAGPGEPPPRVAVAAGRAFTFGYAEHRELLEAAGAEVAEFDPLAAERLPDRTGALVIGGGFPQVYAADLAANAELRAQVRDRAAAGMPVVAECAGLLWLATSLDGREQCGVLPAAARMTSRLTLGYREAVALADSPLAAAGTTVRAHEFHRTASDPAAGPSPAWRLADGSREGWAGPGLLASYLHLHWAGLPGAAARLVAAARAVAPRARGSSAAGTRAEGTGDGARRALA